MSLKKPRIHTSGISNIDFRTKNEIDKIRFYQPFHQSRDFINMGLENYHLPDSVHDKLFKPTFAINEKKYVENDIQNPKIYDTALFYQKNSMRIIPKTFKSGDKIKQLDTSNFRGGHEYNGDSLIIPDIYKMRNQIKENSRTLHENSLKNRLANININNNDNNNNKILCRNKSSVISKNERNVNNYNNNKKGMIKSMSECNYVGKNSINKEKLIQIKNKVYKHLFPHNNIKDIFLNWQGDYFNNHELTVFDLHKIINDLGININYNETNALILSANKRNTNTLNYDEFKSLFLNPNNMYRDYDNIDIDEKNLPNINENKINENQKKLNLSKSQRLIDFKVSKNDNYYELKEIIKNRYPYFLTSMNEIQNNSNKNNNNFCSKETFKEVLDSLKIPNKYKSTEIINSIFNKYSSYNNLNENNSQNLMNYMKFLDDCRNINDKKDFFDFQNNYLNSVKKKLDNNLQKRQKFNDVLIEDYNNKKKYLKSLLNQKSAHEISKSLPSDFYNHYQPSLNFINMIFKDNDKYTQKYNESINELYPSFKNFDDNIKNNMINHERVKKEKMFKKELVGCEKGAPGYGGPEVYDKVDTVQIEKNAKRDLYDNSLRRKFYMNKNFNDKINFQQKLFEINDSLGQIKRTENIYRYQKGVIDANN